MAKTMDLFSSRIKDNSRRRGIPAALKIKRRTEAQQRQAAYNGLSLSDKLKRTKPGTKQWNKLFKGA